MRWAMIHLIKNREQDEVAGLIAQLFITTLAQGQSNRRHRKSMCLNK